MMFFVLQRRRVAIRLPRLTVMTHYRPSTAVILKEGSYVFGETVRLQHWFYTEIAVLKFGLQYKHHSEIVMVEQALSPNIGIQF